MRYLRDDKLPSTNEKTLDVYQEAQYFGLVELQRELESKSPIIISYMRREQFRKVIASNDCEWKLLSSDSNVLGYRNYLDEVEPRKSSYDKLMNLIICIASKQMYSFENSHVILTDNASTRLDGIIVCYNCNRELVDVSHTCMFNCLSSNIVFLTLNKSVNYQEKIINCSKGKNERQSDLVQRRHSCFSSTPVTDSLKANNRNLSLNQIAKFITNDLNYMGFNVNLKDIVCSFSKRCESCITSGLFTAGGILAPKECPNVGQMLEFTWV
ncbi:hypothetical protein GJ496_000275 [Pomphorhynchus laevis]|nr:hypothetical protein GJ496_000275 [Pomphorhynchus laevis]